MILRVKNIDTQVHNLTIDGDATPDLQPNATTELDLGVLAAGNYEMFCQIPGHKDAGMQGTLMISPATDMPAGGSASGAATDAGATSTDHFHGYNSAEEMQAAMDARALRFVEEPKGEFGGERMEPEIAADGTKQFDVTASIVDWEVAPGKIVEAWTYNGVVPGTGDPRRGRRQGPASCCTTSCPSRTVVHFHGIKVPNAMDGVAPYTQPAIEAGRDLHVRVHAPKPAVGIYHSHHNGQVQVPNGMFGAFPIGEMPIPAAAARPGYTATVDQRMNMVVNDAGTIGLS